MEVEVKVRRNRRQPEPDTPVVHAANTRLKAFPSPFPATHASRCIFWIASALQLGFLVCLGYIYRRLRFFAPAMFLFVDACFFCRTGPNYYHAVFRCIHGTSAAGELRMWINIDSSCTGDGLMEGQGHAVTPQAFHFLTSYPFELDLLTRHQSRRPLGRG